LERWERKHLTLLNLSLKDPSLPQGIRQSG
jgi:hypothetical protein